MKDKSSLLFILEIVLPLPQCNSRLRASALSSLTVTRGAMIDCVCLVSTLYQAKVIMDRDVCHDQQCWASLNGDYVSDVLEGGRVDATTWPVQPGQAIDVWFNKSTDPDIGTWDAGYYAAVHYDKTRCPDSLRRAEDDCIRQLKADGCQLLNKNTALRTNSQGVAQKAWREAHGQGTPDSYMAAYCREWRARKRAEREQAEGMVGAE
eukprot:COSAG06_NODE_87_length_24962_cov_107.553795_25_plen_207_part_00